MTVLSVLDIVATSIAVGLVFALVILLLTFAKCSDYENGWRLCGSTVNAADTARTTRARRLTSCRRFTDVLSIF